MAAPRQRARSSRKASSLATAAIALQSSNGGNGNIVSSSHSAGYGHGHGHSRGNDDDGDDASHSAAHSQHSAFKRRKIQRRLEELERTNYKDAIHLPLSLSVAPRERPGHAADSEAGFAIPNSALGEAVAARAARQKQGGASTAGGAAALAALIPAPSPHPPSGTQQQQEQHQRQPGARAEYVPAHKRKQAAALRRLFTYRRGFHALLDDAAADPTFAKAERNYLSAAAAANPRAQSYVYPAKVPFCSVCSERGQVDCPRCGDRTCAQKKCLEVHNDTRCDRPVR